MCHLGRNDLTQTLIDGCDPDEGVLMSTAQHVWALDGNVQSYHRMLTIMVDKGMCRFSCCCH